MTKEQIVQTLERASLQVNNCDHPDCVFCDGPRLLLIRDEQLKFANHTLAKISSFRLEPDDWEQSPRLAADCADRIQKMENQL